MVIKKYFDCLGFLAAVLCLSLHCCASPAKKPPATPSQTVPVTQQEPDNETVVETNYIADVDTQVKAFDDEYFPLLRKTTKSLNMLDNFVAENSIDLYAADGTTGSMNRDYRKIRRAFGTLYTIISEYSLWCRSEVPPLTDPGRFLNQTEARAIIEQIHGYRKKLSVFKDLPDDINALFTRLQQL